MKKSIITNKEIEIVSPDFYTRNDVVDIARSLLGKVLCSNIDGQYCSAVITETEAYAGIEDKGSHSFGGRKTERTKIMFEEGGIAYIYLCYGIHSMFNVVTGAEHMPSAVLIRAVYPLDGIEIMKQRSMHKNFHKINSLNGPGKVCKAMGLHYSMTGLSLQSKNIYIEDHGFSPKDEAVFCGPRIGIEYAGEDALLPYRFLFSYE